MNNAEFREAAKAQYEDEGSIEIDDNAAVSRGSDNGAYVQAWVWVEDDHPSEDDPPSAVEEIDAAELHLQLARNALKAAGATRTLNRVRLSLTSLGGARRHALNAPSREARQATKQ